MSESVPEGYQPLPLDRGFEARIGPLYVRFDDAVARIGVRVVEHHLNPGGRLHGGMSMTLVDEAAALAAFRALGADARFATISLNCDFMAAGAVGDWVEAEAEIVRQTRRLLFVRARAFTADRLLLTASGIWRLFPAGPE